MKDLVVREVAEFLDGRDSTVSPWSICASNSTAETRSAQRGKAAIETTLPLLHRMEERAGERRSLAFDSCAERPLLSPSLSSLGGKRGRKRERRLFFAGCEQFRLLQCKGSRQCLCNFASINWRSLQGKILLMPLTIIPLTFPGWVLRQGNGRQGNQATHPKSVKGAARQSRQSRNRNNTPSPPSDGGEGRGEEEPCI